MLDSYDEQDFDHLVDDMKLKKFRVPRSKTARSIVNRLLARKGYAQVEERDQIQALWNQVVGVHIARHSRCGRLLRGTMEVYVANSLVLQKESLGKAIQDLKFRLGAVD